MHVNAWVHVFKVWVICRFVWFYTHQCGVCICVSACVTEHVCMYMCPTKRNEGSASGPTSNQLFHTYQVSSALLPLDPKFCPLSGSPAPPSPDCHPIPTKPWVALAIPRLARLCLSTGRNQKVVQPQRCCVIFHWLAHGSSHPRKRCLDSLKEKPTQHHPFLLPPSSWALHLSQGVLEAWHKWQTWLEHLQGIS